MKRPKKTKSLAVLVIIVTLLAVVMNGFVTNRSGTGNASAAGNDQSSLPEGDMIDHLRSQFFNGPILDYINLDSLDPKQMPEESQIGASVGFHQLKLGPDRSHLVPEKVLPFAEAAGIKWLRSGYLYKNVADQFPSDTLKASDFMDKWVNMTADSGIKTLVQVNATGNGNLEKYKDNMDKYTNYFTQFVNYLMDRYGNKMGALELVNEPYHEWGKVFGTGNFGPDRWGGSLWVDEYGKFVADVAQAIKEKNPNMPVINGNSEFGPTIGQLKLYPSTPVDGLNFHHYWSNKNHTSFLPETTQSTVQPDNEYFVSSSTKLDQVTKDFDKQVRMITGKDDMQLWITEAGVSMQDVDQKQQAKDVLRALTTGFLSADKMFIYSFIDKLSDPSKRGGTYGLITSDYKPRRSYFAVARLNALTHGVANLDPDFKAVMTNVQQCAKCGLPMWSQIAERPAYQIKLEENIMAKKFNLANGNALLAVWSTARSDNFKARRIEFTVNELLGKRPILVDPLTGDSSVLHTRNVPGHPDDESFKLDVMDYPQYILIHDK